MPYDPARLIAESIQSHQEVAMAMNRIQESIASAGKLLTDCVLAGGTVLLCGNGGSAADAQHIAGELTGRFLTERRALPAIALNTNSTTLTAIGNDYGYDFVFARQVEAHMRPGDLLIAITTSGNSGNVVQAARSAKIIGGKVIGLTGASGGLLGGHCDVCLNMPSAETPRIQEMHILVGHILCQLVDEALED